MYSTGATESKSSLMPIVSFGGTGATKENRGIWGK